MSSNNKCKNELDRMMYLMEYKHTAPKKSTGIEYHTIAADGLSYGIIKEGDTYYIKKTTADKKLVKEAYDYLKGYNYRNEHGYKSYDKAVKHLELQLMAINEKYNKHKDVSVIDFKKGEKDMSILTEEARKEIDRVNQIFENSIKIGMNNTGDPESKGKATDPTKQGDPFSTEAKATLDKDLKATATVKDATPDNTEVKNVESDLTSDKMKKCNCDGDKCTCVHPDIDGESVADKTPNGGKCVKMNESVMGDEIDVHDFEGDESVADLAQSEIPGEVNNYDFTDVEFDTDYTPENETNVDDDLVGFEEEDYDIQLENLLNEFEQTMIDNTEVVDQVDENENEIIVGSDEVLDGPHGDLDVMSWDKTELNEKINKMADMVLERLCVKKAKKSVKKQPKTIQETIMKMVKEEVHKLNDWGKHPKYGKPAFTTPQNTEVIVNKGDKDWDDESAKTDQPYGKKIGSSAPFDKVVELMTDSIVQQIKEGKFLKKK